MKRLTFLAFVPGTGFWTKAGCGGAVTLFGLGVFGIVAHADQKSILVSLLLMFSSALILLMVSASVWNEPRGAYVGLAVALVAALETFIASRMLFRPNVIDGPVLLRG